MEFETGTLFEMTCRGIRTCLVQSREFSGVGGSNEEEETSTKVLLDLYIV